MKTSAIHRVLPHVLLWSPPAPEAAPRHAGLLRRRTNAIANSLRSLVFLARPPARSLSAESARLCGPVHQDTRMHWYV